MSTQMQPEEKLTGRWLRPEEYTRLEALFARHNSPIPDPAVSFIYVIENERGEIIHCQVCMMVWHCEPIATDGRYQGLGLWRESMAKILEKFEGSNTALYAFSDSPRVEHGLTEFDFQKTPYEVYVKRF